MNPVTLAQSSGLGATICANLASKHGASRVRKIMEQTQNEKTIHIFHAIFNVQF